MYEQRPDKKEEGLYEGWAHVCLQLPHELLSIGTIVPIKEPMFTNYLGTIECSSHEKPRTGDILRGSAASLTLPLAWDGTVTWIYEASG